MKKVAIVGLGWLGMPLATALNVEQRLDIGGITDKFRRQLQLESFDAAAACRIHPIPASRTAEGGEAYLQAVQNVVDSALVYNVPRIIFTHR
jgi:nucleoside-diphosphate-sugar epimerase